MRIFSADLRGAALNRDAPRFLLQIAGVLMPHITPSGPSPLAHSRYSPRRPIRRSMGPVLC